MRRNTYKKIGYLGSFVLLLLLNAGSVIAQEPSKWRLEVEPNNQKYEAQQEIELKLIADVEPGWHLYSLKEIKGGPIATTIKSSLPEDFELSGEIQSPEPKIEFDPNFKIDTSFFTDHAEFLVPVKVLEDLSADKLSLDVRFQLCDDTLCLPPKTMRVSLSGSNRVSRDGKIITRKESKPTNNDYRRYGAQDANDQPIWGFIWLAISLGALSLLTPCVFPMIPITVSYFTKNSGGDRTKSIKLALVYSIGIIATFTLLGMLLAIFVGASGINLFAANPWINLLIAAIFLIFAFNLLGYYEINPPSSLVTKLDSIARTKEGQGSAYVGALLMGLTFTITSFTCTSPFVGTLLVSTSQGNWAMPLLGMLVFSTVFALPFFVLALAPQILSQMPKAGGWLNSIKVVMGFLEIAAALKFLSNVDLVWSSAYKVSDTAINYGTIFKREVVLVLWVVIAILIAIYLLGIIRFKYDSVLKKITPFRALFSLFFMALAVYLTLGVFGMKLGELESFLPPKNPNSRLNLLGERDHELDWIANDFDAALRKAKAENKNVFVDFTGYTCTNCRWMEANMFVRQDVRAELQEYVLVSLYTDGDGEIYYKQQQFQEDTFQTVALPFYAVFDPEGKPVATFPGLTRNPAEFIDFLSNSK